MEFVCFYCAQKYKILLCVIYNVTFIPLSRLTARVASWRERERERERERFLTNKININQSNESFIPRVEINQYMYIIKQNLLISVTNWLIAESINILLRV